MASQIRLLALIAGVMLTHLPEAVAAFPKPIHTSKTRFLIPFKFDTAAAERLDAREVQLYVSRDQGTTWELAKSKAPDGGKFDYRALGEGEYWFSVKLVDGRNQLHPPRRTYETGLIVQIDQTTPELDLTVKQAGAGRLVATWRATDANLDPTSLKLEYQGPETGGWKRLELDSQRTGEYSWSVAGTGTVVVRGQISDQALNVGEAKVELTVAGEDPARKRPAHRGAIAGSLPDLVASDVPPPAANAPQDIPLVGQEFRGPIITPQGGLPRYQRLEATETSNTREAVVDTVPFSTGGAQRESQLVSQANPGSGFSANTANQRPSSRQKMVASHQFQIGYKLDDIGPSGISAVELFITEDNGRKWWKYGNDADQKSPFDVEVPHDGIYGFAIRVSNGSGITSDPPLNGDLPEIVVSVDQTAPVIELLPVQQGKGTSANRLLIRWKISEEHPSEKPVSLYYASNPNGQWEPITGWREDVNGAFEWVVGPTVPNQFYLRALARDRAGNIGKVETATPIVVDLTRPSARIVDVEVNPINPPQ